MNEHEKFQLAMHLHQGKKLTTKEIRSYIQEIFPDFKNKVMPNDHAIGNENPCKCAGTEERIFDKVSRGKYKVRYFDESKKMDKLSKQFVFPDEVSELKYIEGATKQVLVNQYERNPKARADCIAHYGCICNVCQIDFSKVYGEIGEGFIHVHHIKDISTIGEEYEVNPADDLIPLCPNCHAMIHTTKPAMTPEKLKEIYREHNV